jgi:predicted transcriptional regulator
METQLITVRLSAPLLHRMDEMARRRNRSRAALVEEALRQFLSSDRLAHSGDDMTCARDAGTDEPLYKMTEG